MKTWRMKNYPRIPRGTALVEPTFTWHETHGRLDCKEGDIRKVYWRTLNFLRRRGFAIETPEDVRRHYPCLARSRHDGIWKALEFSGEIHESMRSERADVGGGNFSLEFFQNVVTENSNGGRYDFQKLKKMPYLLRKRFEWMRRELTALWTGLGFVDESKPDKHSLPPLEFIARDAAESWHYKGMDPFTERQPGDRESYHYLDRDKRRIRPGDRKCFYHYKGHLMIGQAYYNLNNMWWVVTGATRHNLSSSQLFDWRPGLPRRRPVDQNPKVKAALDRAVQEQNYERAIVLRDLIKTREVAHGR